MRSLKINLLAAVLAFAALPVQAAELLMFEEPSCVWCRRWLAEIGPGYPNSDEGKIAPLRRVDIRNGLPPGIAFEQNVTMTPTFVLVEDGEERGRMVGYSGEDFFYPMLDKLLQKVAPRPETAPDAGLVKTSGGERVPGVLTPALDARNIGRRAIP